MYLLLKILNNGYLFEGRNKHSWHILVFFLNTLSIERILKKQKINLDKKLFILKNNN